MNATEIEGQSVWENCPFAVGLNVLLHVVDMPTFALRMGDYTSRLKPVTPGRGPSGLPDLTRFVNGPIVKLGPWPLGDAFPLRVGCSLAVIPAWEVSGTVPFAGNVSAPVFGGNEGLDCRTLDEIELWAVARSSNSFDEIRAWPWVRHPTGIWAIAEGYTSPASAPGHRFRVPLKGADRVAMQVQYTTGAPTGTGYLAYGRLTAPVVRLGTDDPDTFYKVDEQTIRFGAVEAPDEYQRPERLALRDTP
jgi:hypothetical protein